MKAGFWDREAYEPNVSTQAFGRLGVVGEAWIRAQGMTEAVTWTSATNARLIRLYEKHGYAITERAPSKGTMMVRLAKVLAAA